MKPSMAWVLGFKMPLPGAFERSLWSDAAPASKKSALDPPRRQPGPQGLQSPFSQSPTDALADLVVRCRLRRHIPVQFALHLVIAVCASPSSHNGGPRAGAMCGGCESTPM